MSTVVTDDGSDKTQPNISNTTEETPQDSTQKNELASLMDLVKTMNGLGNLMSNGIQDEDVDHDEDNTDHGEEDEEEEDEEEDEEEEDEEEDEDEEDEDYNHEEFIRNKKLELLEKLIFAHANITKAYLLL
jgi:TATA-binding protein-associated factor Taf7